jgi:hypothetical protein
MKKILLSIALAVAAPFAWAQVSETTTTTTTTQGSGTITEYTPGRTIVLKETSGPRTYRFGKTVTYVTRSDGARKAQENRRSASSSKRRRGSGASACCFEKIRSRARRSSSCAGRQRQKVHGAMSCASSIISAHREPLRSSKNIESSWKTWLPWNLRSFRT